MTGEYIVANHFIEKDSYIHESDLKVITGRLDHLPYKAFLNKKDIVKKIALQNISPLKPITPNMIGEFWIVKVNHIVNVIMLGLNFKIILQGKALKNGMSNQIIPVQIYNNKTILGSVNKDGNITVSV